MEEFSTMKPYNKRYRSRNPQPNYSNFGKPEYVDSLGREYKLADRESTDRLLGNLDGNTSDLFDSNSHSLYSSEDKGSCVLWVRIPIRTKNTVEFPDSQSGERLDLLQVNNMVEASAVVEKCFYGSKKKTGYIVVSALKTRGQADPSKWKHISSKNHRETIEKTLF